MSEQLLRQTLAQEYFWSSYARIAQLERNNLTGLNNILFPLYLLALLIGFMLVAFQVVTILYRAYRDETHPAAELIPLAFRAMLISILLSPPIYRTFVRFIIAYPADSAADIVTFAYYDRFMADVQTMMGAFANSPSAPSNFFTALLNGSLLSTVLAMVIFWAAAIGIFLVPLLQSSVFLWLFYVGPVCLIFSLSDLTAGVAKAWLGAAFAVAWLGFFSSLSLLAGQALGIFSALGSGSAAGDVILTFVYGILTLIVFGLGYSIAVYFFGGAVALSCLANSPSAISGAVDAGAKSVSVGAATAMAAGRATSLTGSALSKVGMRRAGTTLRKAGHSTYAGAAKVFGEAQPGSLGPRTLAATRTSGKKD